MSLPKGEASRMDSPAYLRVLKAYRWLVACGVVVALVVAALAGFTVEDGEIRFRVERSYPASTTILLSSPTTPLFQSEIPREELVPSEPNVIVTAPVTLNLTDAALIYAYLVTSKDIQARVEDEIGVLADTESITAVSRTTQPSGDENFPGRLSLPILDVVAFSNDPERAETISRTAAAEFQEYVIEQQERQGIDEGHRVLLTTLRENRAGEGEGSNPAIPIVVAFGGTVVAFIALAFLLAGIRSSIRKRGSEADDDDGPVGEDSPDGTRD